MTKNAIAVAMMLAALMVLQAQPTMAEIMSGTIEDLPTGLQLRRELLVQDFLAREDERRLREGDHAQPRLLLCARAKRRDWRHV
jgi:hypothetical protein